MYHLWIQGKQIFDTSRGRPLSLINLVHASDLSDETVIARAQNSIITPNENCEYVSRFLNDEYSVDEHSVDERVIYVAKQTDRIVHLKKKSYTTFFPQQNRQLINDAVDRRHNFSMSVLNFYAFSVWFVFGTYNIDCQSCSCHRQSRIPFSARLPSDTAFSKSDLIIM